jgi:hypothetical protein
MSKDILLERDFLCLVANSTNYKQLKSVLRTVDNHQFLVLREIALNILKSVISVEPETLIRFKTNKKFIRKLRKGDISKAALANHSELIAEFARLALQYNAICEQARSFNNGGVGESEGEEREDNHE